MAEELVYLNNQLISKGQAKISALDSGFLYGYGVFETMRAYNGKVFRLSQHLDRLTSSLKILGITTGRDINKLEKIVRETVKANKLTDAYVRLTVSIGAQPTKGAQGGAGLDVAQTSDSTLLVVARPFSLYLSNYRHNLEYFYKFGMKAVIVKERANSCSQVPRIKSLNYLQNMLAKKEARTRGADEGILLNTEGNVAEGASSNFFIVKDRRLITPSTEAGILPGITREIVMNLAKEVGLDVREEGFKLDEALEAEECFLTNSLMEIMPLVSVEGRSIGIGKPGRLTLQLHRAYRRLVSQETS